MAEVSRMRSWQTETGQLACRWSEVGQRIPYNPRWMQDASDVPSGYLPPVPDFASHSPFGGAEWFLPHRAGRDCQ
jgi:hypothetical protein